MLAFRDMTLTLDFLSMTFVLTQYLFKSFASTLGEFELFAAHQTDSLAQNLKALHLDIWPDVDLIRDLNPKNLIMDYVRLDGSFQRPLCRFRYDAQFPR